jgi:hypothetical protein
VAKRSSGIVDSRDPVVADGIADQASELTIQIVAKP